MKLASLTVVGTGIKFLSHLTTEAMLYIEQADKVLYLVNDPALKDWIPSINVNSESLDCLYSKYPLRLQCYQEISRYILEELRASQHICVVFYGHPSVFAQPALEAVRQAREEGYDALILPGISAEDCLFADLLINPGSVGCQSYDATDFLIRCRECDNSSHLILWQVGGIGNLKHTTPGFDNYLGAKILIKRLLMKYDSNHEVILYEAAQYSCLESRIEKLPLEKLSSAKFSSISTLYIPPARKKAIDKKMIADLGINMSELY
jgi:tetrapyrrole methylase family protein / MazG family protein